MTEEERKALHHVISLITGRDPRDYDLEDVLSHIRCVVLGSRKTQAYWDRQRATEEVLRAVLTAQGAAGKAVVAALEEMGAPVPDGYAEGYVAAMEEDGTS